MARKKKAVLPSRRSYEVPKFRFKRHRSPESVLQAYVSPPTMKMKVKLSDVEFCDERGKPQDSASSMAAMVRSQGLWGFVETRAKPPIVHFWHDGKRSERELIHFFGHEMGHCMGKPLKDGWPEENRADDYGFVASMAVKAARKHSSR